MRNWAKNIEYGAKETAFPESHGELAAIVAGSEKLKIVGSRHSFNRIADTEARHVSLERFSPSVEIDRDTKAVQVAAHLPYGAFCGKLHRQGSALHNLASLPHISVAGACATGTHGSGARIRNLASAVRTIELVTSEGEFVRLSRGDEGFALAVVGLGALGIATRITLDLEPTYDVRQWVYEDLPMNDLPRSFEDLMRCAYSVSLFTNWMSGNFTQVWLKQRIDEDESALEQSREIIEGLGARAATRPHHPVDGAPDCCTPQLGEPGPWHERLPHFRMSFTPSAGKELQSEYFVAFADAQNAIRAISELHEQVAPVLLVSEIRAIAADEFPMSPCFGRESVAIHFTWRQQLAEGESMLASGLTPEVAQVLPQIEEALAPFDARPHLGKLCTMDQNQLAKVYHNLPSLGSAMLRYDPNGKFRNAFLDQLLGVPA